MHVLMYQQSKVLIIFRHGPEGYALSCKRAAQEILNTVGPVFVEDHVSLPVLLLAFSLYSVSADQSWSKHTDHSQPHFL